MHNSDQLIHKHSNPEEHDAALLGEWFLMFWTNAVPSKHQVKQQFFLNSLTSLIKALQSFKGLAIAHQ